MGARIVHYIVKFTISRFEYKDYTNLYIQKLCFYLLGLGKYWNKVEEARFLKISTFEYYKCKSYFVCVMSVKSTI